MLKEVTKLFNNEGFYPTPKELLSELLSTEIEFNGRYRKFDANISGNVLEPSAGKGDIADYIKSKNRHVSIDLIELDEHLVSILYGKGYNVVWRDFLTYETHKQYDYIILNPPLKSPMLIWPAAIFRW